MFDLSVKDEDAKWLKEHYPGLKLHRKEGSIAEIVGVLSFSMTFLQEKELYVINPNPDYSDGVKIEDEYQIRIELKRSKFSNLPQVYETDYRLLRVVESRGIQKEDLHINPKSGSTCLCIKPEENIKLPNGFNLQVFFNELLIPFFYAQSYFEKNNSWPWGQYSHGVLGFIEWYLEQDNLTREKTEDFLGCLRKYNNKWQLIKKWLAPKYKVKGHHMCVCGKDEKFRNCHNDVLSGICKLKQNIAKFGIKIQ